jgi:protein archease
MSGVPTLSGHSSGWEHVPHGADVGIRGWGGDVAAAFEQAALATTAIVVDPSLIRLETSVDISCEAASLEDLLVEWLNAVIFRDVDSADGVRLVHGPDRRASVDGVRVR